MGPIEKENQFSLSSAMASGREMEGRRGDEEPLLRVISSSQEEEDGGLARDTWQESKRLWQVAGPSILSRVAMFSLTIITQAFTGHLSDLDLAAMSVVTTVFISIAFAFLLGTASALETLCGQAFGAKRYISLGIYLQRSWIVLFLCSIVLLPLFVFASPLLKLIGQTSELADKTGIVANWLIPMYLSFPFQLSLQRFLQCQLKTGVITWVTAGTLVIHALISWVFVYKLRVGIVGTCLTLDFSWWLSFFGMLIYCVCGWCPLTWTGFSMEAFVDLWGFFKLSIASGIMLLLDNLYYRVLILLSGYTDNSEVAVDALSICISLYVWESMIPLGFLAAAGVRVSNDLGAGNAKGAKFATTVSVLTSLVIGIIFWLIALFFPDKLATIFTSSSSIVSEVENLSILLAFTILLNCVQPVLLGVAVGSGRQALVAFINMGSYYIGGLAIGILSGWLSNFNILAIWCGMLSGSLLQTLALTIITLRCDWGTEAEKAQTRGTIEIISGS